MAINAEEEHRKSEIKYYKPCDNLDCQWYEEVEYKDYQHFTPRYVICYQCTQFQKQDLYLKKHG